MECIGRIVTVIVINAIFPKEHMIQIYLIVAQFLATKRRVNKMRLIDADKLIENHFSDEHNISLSYANKLWMRKIINLQPTVDAVPVVRCFNCRASSLTKTTNTVYCMVWERIISKNGLLHYQVVRL